MKQPKCFYSSHLPKKEETVALVLPDKEDRLVTVGRAIGSSVRAIPRSAILGVGLLSLVAMSVLSFLPAILSKGSSDLIAILPKQSNAALVAQVSSGLPQGVSYDVKIADARVEIVASFLTRYKSPLQPANHYAQVLVDDADKYNLDYRLLPAIMMQESNLCKTSDPKLHNCLGFGIHKGGTLGFDSYEESFDRASRELKERYIDVGLVTPEQIMTKYTPSSNGSWADSVNQWIAEMEHNDRTSGITSKQDADLTQYTR